MEKNKEVLVYVKFLYQGTDGKYRYQLFFSITPDDVWGLDWDVTNPSTNPDLSPDDTTYDKIYTVKSSYKWKTLQDTSCFSMEYAIYRMLALSWIDLENLDEYPENGRCVLHFGDTEEEVKNILEPFGITLEN